MIATDLIIKMVLKENGISLNGNGSLNMTKHLENIRDELSKDIGDAAEGMGFDAGFLPPRATLFCH